MNIVIIGAGKVGEELCRTLSQSGHDVVLIEKDAKRLEQLISVADIKGVVGNGAIYDTQMEAGVDNCEIFLAVSPHDETNIIAAITARKIGAKNTIARVRDPDFNHQIGFVRESLGITMMINPEMEAAHDITRIIQFPSALGIEHFSNGRVNIVEVIIGAESPLAGKQIKDIRDKNLDVLVCIIRRGETIIVPKGDTMILAGDHIHVTGTIENLNKVYINAKSYRERIRSVLIVGAHRIAYYLIPRLTRLGLLVKVIEIDPVVASELAAEFPEIEVIEGDGTDQNFLQEERLTNYDAVVALTGIDEENLLLSLYATSQGVKKTITKVNRTDLLKVLEKQGLDSIVTPRRLIADIIIRFVRALENSQGSNIDALYRIADNQVEALQFTVTNGSKVKDVQLMKLRLKNNLIVAAIIRGNKVIVPGGLDKIMLKDRVIIVTTHTNFKDIDDIIA